MQTAVGGGALERRDASRRLQAEHGGSRLIKAMGRDGWSCGPTATGGWWSVGTRFEMKKNQTKKVARISACCMRAQPSAKDAAAVGMFTNEKTKQKTNCKCMQWFFNLFRKALSNLYEVVTRPVPARVRWRTRSLRCSTRGKSTVQARHSSNSYRSQRCKSTSSRSQMRSCETALLVVLVN